jgi:hypothetical protein
MDFAQKLFTMGCMLAGSGLIFSTTFRFAKYSKSKELMVFIFERMMIAGTISMIGGIGVKNLFLR